MQSTNEIKGISGYGHPQLNVEFAWESPRICSFREKGVVADFDVQRNHRRHQDSHLVIGTPLELGFHPELPGFFVTMIPVYPSTISMSRESTIKLLLFLQAKQDIYTPTTGMVSEGGVVAPRRCYNATTIQGTAHES